MNYHNITKDDLLNGEGIRVVLWVAGCGHHCDGCQNPETWAVDGGIEFDELAEVELFEALDKSYVDGITFSGGDPLNPANRSEVFRLMKKFRELFPSKTIWLYTGYTWEQIRDLQELSYIDVLAEGRFVEKLMSIDLPWVGSKNQRVIDVRKSTRDNIVLL